MPLNKRNRVVFPEPIGPRTAIFSPGLIVNSGKEGLSALIQTIERIQTTTNPDLEITGLIRTMYDARNKLSNEVSVQLQQYFSKKVFKTIIPRNIKLAEAPSFGQAAINYARSSKGAISYVSLASEIVGKQKTLN
jgi:chromosome partitioning protein